MDLRKKIAVAARAIRYGGVRGAVRLIRSRLRPARQARAYRKWIEANSVTDERRSDIKECISQFAQRPLISVLLPVYNIEEKWLRKCIDSVRSQLYEDWELCIADDASTRPHIRPVLEEFRRADPRIKVVFRDTNGHISAASNSALERVTGEFTVLLDHDDELSEDALFWVASEINRHPDVAMIYSDEDLIDVSGRRSLPKFKPDFSRDLLYSLNLVTHLSAYRTALLRDIGGFLEGFEGSQDYDLALRVMERIPECGIRHIPRILYHWRTVETSVAGDSGAKPYAYERSRQALREHFDRTGVSADVEPAAYNLNRVRYKLPSPLPLVSLVTRDEGWAARIISNTGYAHVEVVRVDDSTAASLNKAVLTAKGDVICFIESGLLPTNTDWLSEMIGFALQPGIGAVGPKIVDAAGFVVQAGMLLDPHSGAYPAFTGWPGHADGYFLRARLAGNFSAVSSICLVIERQKFESIGGFDEENLPNTLFDADLCLKLWEKGIRTVLTPYAKLRQSAAGVRSGKGNAREREYFISRWRKYVEGDPFYNPNLSEADEGFSIKI